MHVGHLRSTIIGDAVARVLEALGHRVIAAEPRRRLGHPVRHAADVSRRNRHQLGAAAAIWRFYRAGQGALRQRPRTSPTAARRRGGSAAAATRKYRRRWQRFIEISLSHCQAGLRAARGDPAARARHGRERLQRRSRARWSRPAASQGLLEESQGARCVFLDEFTGKDGEPLPLIVQKSDGGYLYATTDLAAVRHRARSPAADRVMYLHRRAPGPALPSGVRRGPAGRIRAAGHALEHHPFGAMLGADGKPFKTRAADVVKLIDCSTKPRPAPSSW
jgi:arginyl-tRNA synthetase